MIRSKRWLQKRRPHARVTSKIHAVEAGGIPPALGAAAFARIMAADVKSGIVVLADGLAVAVDSTGVAARPLATSSRGSEDVEATLAGWWQELLGVEQVGLDDDFFELGGHSLIVVRLFSEIKKTYGAAFPLSTLFEVRMIRQLAQLVRDTAHEPERAAKTSPTLVPIQPKGSRPPLYVISGLGGNVIKFHTMAYHLGEDQPVYGLLPRGLDGREPYHTHVEDMAAHYVQAIVQAQPQGPYHLVGYSFGGAVALEVAQQLIAQGATSGSWACSTRSNGPTWSRWIATFARTASRAPWRRTRLKLPARIHSLRSIAA